MGSILEQYFQDGDVFTSSASRNNIEDCSQHSWRPGLVHVRAFRPGHQRHSPAHRDVQRPCLIAQSINRIATLGVVGTLARADHKYNQQLDPMLEIANHHYQTVTAFADKVTSEKHDLKGRAPQSDPT